MNGTMLVLYHQNEISQPTKRTSENKIVTGEKFASFTFSSVAFLKSGLVCDMAGLGRVSTGCRTRSSGRGTAGSERSFDAVGGTGDDAGGGWL